MRTENVERKEQFQQVCVWPGVTGAADDIPGFEKLFDTEFKTRVQFLEEIETEPDRNERGQLVPETGGRRDVLFAVHADDIAHFAVPRMLAGIRWIEDVLDNEADHTPGYSIYPTRFVGYRCW